MQSRRDGDPSSLVASNRRATEMLQWSPHYDDLKTICATLLNGSDGCNCTRTQSRSKDLAFCRLMHTAVDILERARRRDFFHRRLLLR